GAYGGASQGPESRLDATPKNNPREVPQRYRMVAQAGLGGSPEHRGRERLALAREKPHWGGPLPGEPRLFRPSRLQIRPDAPPPYSCLPGHGQPGQQPIPVSLPGDAALSEKPSGGSGFRGSFHGHHQARPSFGNGKSIGADPPRFPGGPDWGPHPHRKEP